MCVCLFLLGRGILVGPHAKRFSTSVGEGWASIGRWLAWLSQRAFVHHRSTFNNINNDDEQRAITTSNRVMVVVGGHHEIRGNDERQQKQERGFTRGVWCGNRVRGVGNTVKTGA